MRRLDSILKTIESVKKNYPAFKIKVASVQIYDLENSDNEKIVEVLSTYNVAQLNVDYVMK